MAEDAARRGEVVHVVHGYPQQFTKRKSSKKRKERPTTALFFSSNDNGNDHLKSGQRWSEELGAPQKKTIHILDLHADVAAKRLATATSELIKTVPVNCDLRDAASTKKVLETWGVKP